MKNAFFSLLPLGSVRAKGFLKDQLEMQSRNFTGKMEQYPDYDATSGWLGGTGESWERGPYYIRGLVALAYSLGDETLIQRAKKWIDYPLEHQDEDGNFYPMFDYAGNDPKLQAKKENARLEWWPRMPYLMALRDYYEAEKLRGYEDHRVLPFMKRYFAFQLHKLPDFPLKDWAEARGGDNVDVVLWLYRLTGESWLIDLCKLLLSQTNDWTYILRHTDVRLHVVNTTQGLRTPALAYLLTGDEKHTEAILKGLESVRKDHGRIDFLPNADEVARDHEFHHGTETCAVAEGMLSMEIAGRATGNSAFYDYLERWAYNSLPNCYWYDLSRHCYFQQQNQVMASVGYHGYINDHGDSCTFGAPAGYDCCFANGHMAWPKFVQNLWVKAEDGIAATVYAPCEIRTGYAGKQIAFTEETSYPFNETVILRYTGETCSFSLRLRVPDWSAGYALQVNGAEYASTPENGWINVKRVFEPGDTLVLKLKAEIQILPWYHHAVYVKRGALLYCLPIRENVEETDADEYREIRYHSPLKTFCAYPDEPWAYALDPEDLNYRQNGTPVSLTPENPPCEIRARMRFDANWTVRGNVAAMHDDTRLVYDEGQMVEKRLIPYACSRLKIALMPKVFHLDPDMAPSLDLRAAQHADVLTVDYPVPEDTDEWLLRINETYFLPHRNTYSMKGKPFYTRDQYSVTHRKDEQAEIQMYYFKSGKMTAKSHVLFHGHK